MQFQGDRQKTFFQGRLWPHSIQGWTATPETVFILCTCCLMHSYLSLDSTSTQLRMKIATMSLATFVTRIWMVGLPQMTLRRNMKNIPRIVHLLFCIRQILRPPQGKRSRRGLKRSEIGGRIRVKI